MLRYPSVAFPALFYAVTYGFASIEPALTLAPIFTRLYHFDTVKNGLANGVSFLVGGSLGGLCSGPVTDYMMRRARQRHEGNGEPPAEIHLQGIRTGAIAVPVGLLIWIHRSVFQHLRRSVHWDGVCLVLAYKLLSRSATRISAPGSFFRQLLGMTLGFYSIPFGEKIGFQLSFTLFAIVREYDSLRLSNGGTYQLHVVLLPFSRS
ncbi:hypothetical protein BDN71DRAFT_1003919 [Pleurotus eryngii]|uniref:Uncharacterized protein n=1 Tax=Pleurotus eryngii TaxID=5323 RepID=A0A9P6DF68_PLEER|nr:hypothetical protein BDN71DRAFT_1003919 [Pleurotus eryngii]